jgi:RecA-family ATPase
MFWEKVVLNTLNAYKYYTYIICEVFVLATITLSVPNDLKEKMNRTDWINWSSVARRAFVNTLIDLEKLENMKKIEEISEISLNDKRVIKDSVVSSAVRKTRLAEKNLASGKTKLLSQKEFDEWCKKL